MRYFPPVSSVKEPVSRVYSPTQFLSISGTKVRVIDSTVISVPMDASNKDYIKHQNKKKVYAAISHETAPNMAKKTTSYW